MGFVRFSFLFTFQSTLPARGATSTLHHEWQSVQHFNPRSPHGERRRTTALRSGMCRISIHAPRTGSDPEYGILPVSVYISIHAPRTGSDAFPCPASRTYSNFNPRSPHGERLKIPLFPAFVQRHFNPRSPHGERPPRGGRTRRRNGDFNPRSPHGERPRKVTILSIRIIGFAQKVYHKTVLLRISLAENAVILPEKPRNPVRTSLQKAGGLRFARAIRAARPYSISSPSGA